MSEEKVRDEIWRWRQNVLAKAVRKRMAEFVSPPRMKALGGSTFKLKWQRRPPGLRFLRIWTGRLYRSIVGTGAEVPTPMRTGPETIHEVRFEDIEGFGPVVRQVSVGSRVPYAARHEFRPHGWEPYFRPALEETAEDLARRVAGLYFKDVGENLEKKIRVTIDAAVQGRTGGLA